MAKSRPKVAVCSRRCRGMTKGRFRKCVSDCAKGLGKWRKSKRRKKRR